MIKIKKGLIKIIIKFKLADMKNTHHITQQQLAARTNFTQSYISKLVRCIKSPTLDTVAIIATALNVNPCDLIEIINIKKVPRI